MLGTMRVLECSFRGLGEYMTVLEYPKTTLSNHTVPLSTRRVPLRVNIEYMIEYNKGTARVPRWYYEGTK